MIQPNRTTHNPSIEATRISTSVSREPYVSKFAQALSIIAEESGIALMDLTDGTNFGDVGIDSLLGLTVSARFKEELDVDFDFNALFFECLSVGDLRIFLKEPEIITTGSSSVSSPNTSSTPESRATRNTTPADETNDFATKLDFRLALQIISEENGVAIEDLTYDTNFADSGVDSLLSLVIASRLRDELELDIRHESLFLECPTVSDLRRLLLGDTDTKGTAQPLAENKPSPTPMLEVAENTNKTNTSLRTEMEDVALTARKKAVDDYV